MAKINPFVFIDFETGGVECTENPITEIAMVAIEGDSLKQMATYESYVKPYGVSTKAPDRSKLKPKDNVWQDEKSGLYSIYTDSALVATGIDWKQIDSGKELKVVVLEILEFLKKVHIHGGAQYRPILVAHNAQFDKGMLHQIMTLTKKMKDLAKVVFGEEDYFGNFQPEFLDSLHFFKMWFGFDEDLPNWKLASCIARAGSELSDGHRALNDTVGLKEAITKGIRLLRSGIEGAELKGMKVRDNFHF